MSREIKNIHVHEGILSLEIALLIDWAKHEHSYNVQLSKYSDSRTYRGGKF